MENAIVIPHKIENLHTAQELFDLLSAREDNPFTMVLCSNEQDWLKTRGFGASEAATILGMTDEWKTRRQLFEEKVGIRLDKFEGNEFTRLGQVCEPLIRALYAAEHPDYDVYDATWLVFVSKENPAITASLDMVIVERATGRILIGEIKTAVWSKKWGEYCPDNYFAQMCQQIGVTKFNGVMLLGRIRSLKMELTRTASERTYYFGRENPAVTDNVKFVMGKVAQFAQDCATKMFKPTLNLM